MLWWKSKGADILDIVRVNDRIQIEMGRSLFLSRVEDVCAETLVIAAPVEEGDVISMFPSTEVVLKVFLPDGVRRFSARVKRMYFERVPVVEMERFKDLGILQRRKYQRAPAKLTVHFRTEKKTAQPGPWREGTTLDISVGGLQISEKYTTTHLAVGDFLDVKISMPDSEINAICNVVRAQKPNAEVSGSNRFAVEFAEMEPQAQERFTRYVEKKWLESEADRRRYVRCRVPIEVHFKQVNSPARKSSCRDASTGGLRMLASGQEFVVGETVDLTISLPHKRLQVESVVVWIGDTKVPDDREIGVKFTKMDQRSRDALAKFLLTVQRGDSESHSTGSGQAKAA